GDLCVMGGGVGRWHGLGGSFVLVGLSLAAAPALTRADIDPARLAGIRERMQRFVDQKDIAGAVTLVGRRDRILSVEAVGNQDITANLPMKPDALFRIASMTKPITAIGIMILV